MKYQHSTGWIEVVCGSMFSGKSEELIRRVKRAEIARQKVQVFKPIIDNRYGLLQVSSHSGAHVSAIPVGSSQEILQKIAADVEVVAIDEAQFFDAEIAAVCDLLADQGKRVIVAGLDMDFKGEPFGPMPRLMTQAEEVSKLHAICIVCGAPATRTQRLIDGRPADYNDPLIVIGASESYQARCRKCHTVTGKPA
jgi:thymidine kinase